jgi:hypothetical protein
MWMDTYLHETLIRQRIAEVERHAAERQLLRRPPRPGAGSRLGALVARLVRGVRAPGPTRAAGPARTRLLLEGPIVSTLLRLAAPERRRRRPA